MDRQDTTYPHICGVLMDSSHLAVASLAKDAAALAAAAASAPTALIDDMAGILSVRLSSVAGREPKAGIF